MRSKSLKNKVIGFPVSYAQRRMWFLSRLESEKLLNNSTIKVQFYGEINHQNLEQSLQYLVKRHESFRTNFLQIENGQVIQIVKPKISFRLVYEDLSATTSLIRRRQLKELTEENTKRIFDLSNSQLVRATLIKQQDKKYILLITLHHIISDAWTLAFIWNELSQIYDHFQNASRLILPDLPIQYRDYAAWEQSPDFLVQYEKQRSYWQKKMRGAPALINLPLDFPRPKVQTYNHRSLEMEFSPKEVSQIEDACRRYRVTSYTFFLSGFILLLHEFSGSSDIVVGTYAANRDKVESENLAGVLLNSLPIRTNLQLGNYFSEFIEQVNQTILEAMKNQEYPFEKILENLRLKRDPSHPPLFNVVFQEFNLDTNLLQKTFVDTRKKIKFFNSNFFQHDLIIRIGVEAEKIGFDFNYNTDLFGKDTIRRMATLYKKIIKKISTEQNFKIGDFKILSKKEKHFLEKKYLIQEKTEDLNLNLFENQAENGFEKIIIKIWQEVLGDIEIDRNDSYFRIGGHSLNLIQVYEKLNQKFPGYLQVTDLFRYFTPASLSTFLCREKKEKQVKIKSDKKYFNQIISEIKRGELSVEEALVEIMDY